MYIPSAQPSAAVQAVIYAASQKRAAAYAEADTILDAANEVNKAACNAANDEYWATLAACPEYVDFCNPK